LLYQRWGWLQNTYIFILNSCCPFDCYSVGRNALLLVL
jgi:hypothetical protein